MLAKARQILVSELALAQKTPEEEAESRLDESSPPEPFRARAQAVTHTVASCP